MYLCIASDCSPLMALAESGPCNLIPHKGKPVSKWAQQWAPLSVVKAGYVHFPSTNCVCLTDCFLHYRCNQSSLYLDTTLLYMLCLSTYVLLPWKPIGYKVIFQCTKGLFEVISQFAVHTNQAILISKCFLELALPCSRWEFWKKIKLNDIHAKMYFF